MSTAGTLQPFVRSEGASLRNYLTGIALKHGDEVALAVAKRVVWEVCDLVGETHGPTVVISALDEARAGIQLDMAPPIEMAGQPDGLTLAAHAIEGLQTITNQNREAVVALIAAIRSLAAEVRRGR